MGEFITFAAALWREAKQLQKLPIGLLVLVAWIVLATSGVQAAGGAPIVVPLFEEFDDLNPCTGEVVTYTFTGTARIKEFDDHFILVAKGTVVTSDGFSGSFNRQFVFQGDRVAHLRFHDMEVSDDTGQRIMFGVGLLHETSVAGETVVSFLHFSGLRCVGPG